MYNFGQFGGMYGGFARNFWVFWVIMYIVGAITLYFISKKARVRKPWVSFIPVLQYIKYLHIIDKSGWSIFLLLIPGVNIVLSIIWAVKFYLAFKVSVVLIVLSIIIAPVGWVMMFVIAFSEKYAYVKTNKYGA